MRSIVPFLIGLLSGACAAHTTPPATVSNAPALSFDVDRASDSTVALIYQVDGVPHPMCAGVWVSPTSILTADHCIESVQVGEPVAYATRSDVFAGDLAPSHPRTRVALVFAHEAEHDLALLRGIGVSHSYVTVARVVRQGERAHSVGHSLGLWWSYSSGDVSAVRWADLGDGNALWIQTTTPTSKGNSGGGLFADDGALIGVAHGTIPGGQNVNFYSHPFYVAALLEAHRGEL